MKRMTHAANPVAKDELAKVENRVVTHHQSSNILQIMLKEMLPCCAKLLRKSV